MTTLPGLDVPEAVPPSPWRPIGDAPRDGSRVCLWIERGDDEGYELRGCHWNVSCQPADWWHQPEGRGPGFAVPIGQHASHWRPDDGTAAKRPGRMTRTFFNIEDPRTWPEGYRERLRAHHVGFAEATRPFSLDSDAPRI